MPPTRRVRLSTTSPTRTRPATGVLADVAEALHHTSDTLRDNDQEAFAKYADVAARQPQQAASGGDVQRRASGVADAQPARRDARAAPSVERPSRFSGTCVPEACGLDAGASRRAGHPHGPLAVGVPLGVLLFEDVPRAHPAAEAAARPPSRRAKKAATAPLPTALVAPSAASAACAPSVSACARAVPRVCSYCAMVCRASASVISVRAVRTLTRSWRSASLATPSARSKTRSKTRSKADRKSVVAGACAACSAPACASSAAAAAWPSRASGDSCGSPVSRRSASASLRIVPSVIPRWSSSPWAASSAPGAAAAIPEPAALATPPTTLVTPPMSDPIPDETR